MYNTANKLPAFILTLLLMPLLLASCGDNRVETVVWTEYEPVYMSKSEFENAVKLEPARELENPGKIYFHEGYLFVNEINKGVHIIDNRNPSSPSFSGFINIPANKDIAVRGNLLYADSSNDLLVFDIQNMQDAQLISRKEDVFSFQSTSHRGFPYRPVDASKGVVIDWIPVEVEEVCDGDCHGHLGHTRGPVIGGPVMASDGVRQSGGSASGGTGGSMARFAIAGHHLYAVDYNNLLTFDISSAEPAWKNKTSVGWAIETIFPYGDELFIGSESAMYIYDITNPSAPNQLSVYRHLTACDPVVVEGDFAYVTLRDGELCPRGVNRLEVLDIADRKNPKKIAVHEMINPHGLGIDDGNLFISEGDAGLKVLDAKDPFNIKELRHIENIKTFDVIPMQGVLMVTGRSGITQYDYSDINDLKVLSTIPVVSK